MMCQNCGKHEANVRYTEIINGVKKEMALCEECSRKLGIDNKMNMDMNFNMPIDIPSFLGEFLGDYGGEEFMPAFPSVQELTCNECGMTYNDFVNTGKFGCHHCYDVFSDRIDPILKNIQGSNRHVGRRGRLNSGKIKMEKPIQIKKEQKQKKKEKTELDNLQQDLKKAIQEERYEDAAVIRDKIKKIDKEDK
ncbi:MAG: UvrB/UvrC motif-containing protein [Clostridia bacterium]